MHRALLLSFAILALAAIPAEAHRSPAACTANNLEVQLNRDTTSVRNGDALLYSVWVANPGATACELTNVAVTVRLPAADGTATGGTRSFAAGALPPGSAPTKLGEVSYAVAIDAGVETVVASASASGLLHDVPADTSLAGVQKTLATLATWPALTLAVAPTPASGIVPLNVTYDYVLSNTSTTEVPIANPTINGGGCAPIERVGSDDNNRLDTGESWSFRCLRLFTSPTTLTSTVNAFGTSDVDDRTVLSNTKSAVVTAAAPPRPRMTLTKTVSPASGIAPLTATYTYTVLNDSDPAAHPLHSVTITDPGCAPAVRAGSDPQLERNEAWTFTCSKAVPAGIHSSTAFATGLDAFDNQPVYSALAGADAVTTVDPAPVVTPVPTPFVLESEATPTPVPAPTATATPTPTPTPTLSKRVTLSANGRLARPCRGTVTTTLKTGRTTVATKRVRLDSRCRYRVRYDVLRSRLRGATRVTVTARLGKRTATKRISVPRR